MVICTNFIKYENGHLKGFADFFVPKWGIEIKSCSFCVKEEKRWINLPSKEFVNDEGQKKFSPYIRFQNQEHWKVFCTQAKHAVDSYLLENQELSNGEENFNF